jgi:hypothetical protein
MAQSNDHDTVATPGKAVPDAIGPRGNGGSPPRMWRTPPHRVKPLVRHSTRRLRRPIRARAQRCLGRRCRMRSMARNRYRCS